MERPSVGDALKKDKEKPDEEKHSTSHPLLSNPLVTEVTDECPSGPKEEKVALAWSTLIKQQGIPEREDGESDGRKAGEARKCVVEGRQNANRSRCNARKLTGLYLCACSE